VKVGSITVLSRNSFRECPCTQKQLPGNVPVSRNSFREMFLSPETVSGKCSCIQKQLPGNVPVSRNSFQSNVPSVSHYNQPTIIHYVISTAYMFSIIGHPSADVLFTCISSSIIHGFQLTISSVSWPVTTCYLWPSTLLWLQDKSTILPALLILFYSL
jgi:hypothetical protein